MIRNGLSALVVGLAFCLGAAAQAGERPADARLSSGQGSFVFPFLSAGEMREITVWYHRPERVQTDAPIVFVLHGASRNARTYRKYWIPLADEHRFVLLVPEFSADHFPGTRNYNLGNVLARNGARFPEAQWGYTAIEDIFDAVRAANSLSAATYDIYGHSAGGQFVHRLVMLKPGARYRVAVAANSGWYMMPDFDVAYPYGLRGAGVDRRQVARVFGRRLVVLLGDHDTDPNHHQLSRTPGALAQGEHRLARGQAFYERARQTAADMGAPFAWSLTIVPGVAHSNARMAPHAAAAMTGTH
jgi:poly(3-hydroxybutyrate) depolymerase